MPHEPSSETSSTDSSDVDDIVQVQEDLDTITLDNKKKSITTHILQARYAIKGREVNYITLLAALTALSARLCNATSLRRVSKVQKVACIRTCYQVRSCLTSESFPDSKQGRRRLGNKDQARASIRLYKRGDGLLCSIEACFPDLAIPAELMTDESAATLNNIERFLLLHPSIAIPIELLNTFEFVCIRMSLAGPAS